MERTWGGTEDFVTSPEERVELCVLLMGLYHQLLSVHFVYIYYVKLNFAFLSLFLCYLR